MKIKKTIILEFDESKEARILKPDNMTPMECINLLIAVVACYYKEDRGITSISEAAQAIAMAMKDMKPVS